MNNYQRPCRTLYAVLFTYEAHTSNNITYSAKWSSEQCEIRAYSKINILLKLNSDDGPPFALSPIQVMWYRGKITSYSHVLMFWMKDSTNLHTTQGSFSLKPMIVGLDVRDALKQGGASVVPVTLYSSKRQESSQF